MSDPLVGVVLATAALWGYLWVGRRLARSVARAVYKQRDARFCDRYPSLSHDRKYRHYSVNEDAMEAFWFTLAFWPIVLVIMGVRGRSGELDFSPENEALQQRIAELETELGMKR